MKPLLLLATLMALLLTACGPQATSPPVPTQTPAHTSTPVPSPTPPPTPTPNPEEELAAYLAQVEKMWPIVTMIWTTNRANIVVGVWRINACLGSFQRFTALRDEFASLQVPADAQEIHEAVLWCLKAADNEAAKMEAFCTDEDVIWSDIDTSNYMLGQALADLRALLLSVKPVPFDLITSVSELGQVVAGFSQDIAIEDQKSIDSLLDLFR